LKLAHAAGLVQLGAWATDGSKFPGNASRHKAMSYGYMNQEEERLQAEIAALLHEAGARVDLVTRRPIVWFGRDRTEERTLLERIKAPSNGMAPGWANWTLERVPFVFYRFPQDLKDKYNSNYVSGATDWLRNSIIGKATLHERQEVTTADAVGDRVRVTLSNGTKIEADHVLLSTGYKVDLDRLTMIHPSLRSRIAADRAVPVLSSSFESSVPGLYFVGLTSMRAFGPLFRFVVGCRAAAGRVARSVSRRSRRAPR
jgi:hypothetical protein